ncbi:DHA2 family efflux MFS transporter permease subunit [Pedobacter sp. ISL-68]|uniref:DHA2 family efflux MFS transporter permease subunit n=1 Tax=unclassified Pedobacter TaxID=2628915 RepID=UPI001BE8B3C0|nr:MULTISPECIES: DHA2 family efflux MFS transporter permease subunit [unclassified Pedobacter]MBT2560081.1 DHA2 family efflux MFS transporter permease subunit [Pedobacter sp. ISL-64]MBT2589060.1 DHA2 family efflux MFS transporter permease subunit [Pedobacter sp. ISL-68]
MKPIHRTILLLTVIAAAIMELIDISIVNVALSHMSGNLGATLEDTSWVITAYAIANVIIIPMTSFLTTNLGRRNYYIGSVVLFVFCSFMCGNSSNIWELVCFRFLQGLGGGALLSVSAAVVYELFPKEKQATASAIFGVGIFLGPTIGPTLGGYITEFASWPWIFYINLPIGVLVAFSCYMLLPEPVLKGKKTAVDWTGIGLLATGIGALQTVLERGQAEDWFDTGYIVILTVVAVISLASFIYWELRVSNPVVDLRVLKSKELAIAAVLTFITGIGMFTSIYLTPVLSQRLLSFSPSQTGVLLLPGSFVALLVLVLSGKILQKGVSPVLIVLFGFICFIYFNWSMSQISLNTSSTYISIALIFRAAGMAFLTVPLTTLAISSLEAKDMPQGAALNNMMRQLGGSFGISILNTYVARRMGVHRTDLISNITEYNPIATERIHNLTKTFQQRGFDQSAAYGRAMKVIDNTVQKHSLLLSYIDGYLFIGIFFALAIPLLLLVAKRRKGPIVIASADH